LQKPSKEPTVRLALFVFPEHEIPNYVNFFQENGCVIEKFHIFALDIKTKIAS